MWSNHHRNCNSNRNHDPNPNPHANRTHNPNAKRKPNHNRNLNLYTNPNLNPIRKPHFTYEGYPRNDKNWRLFVNLTLLMKDALETIRIGVGMFSPQEESS